MSCRVVSDKRFNQVFEFLDKEILDLIPFSKCVSFYSLHPPDIHLLTANNLPFQRCFLKKFYWIPEVEYMASELGKYASDISLRKPAAKQRLSEFIEHRKEVVKLTREVRLSPLQPTSLNGIPSVDGSSCRRMVS